ncbi:glycosyltransferase [Blautia sp. HCP3S3_C12]|uniref:glycosyltransferase n=1 Tax=unclassified Blautia TaxID=2648079 RepID=UPI003F889D5B
MINKGFQQSKKQIVYEPTAVCYTGVPHSIKRLLHQRDRWQRGLMDCLIKHHNLIANPRYGLLGLVTMCYQLMVELLGPIFWVIYTVLLIDKNMFPFFFGGVCRICFGANRTDDICSIHRYREKYGESFEVDTETDFNNNRRNGVANTHYGSEGSWNAYIPLAKTCLVDLIFSQYCRV